MDQMSTSTAPRVQIIDPDVQFREALAAHLRGRGYRVETCGSLDAGLGQAAEAGFDLILVEHALPETLGLTILPTLHACQKISLLAPLRCSFFPCKALQYPWCFMFVTVAQ
jgi:CheY-like chemotaxis protein